MILRKKPHVAEQPRVPEPSETLGFHLKVRLSEQGDIELRLSEKVALTLAPWLAILMVGSTCLVGVWLWSSYQSRVIAPSNPTIEIQPRK